MGNFISIDKLDLLESLCKCKAGKGLLLDSDKRRLATQLIRKRWVEWMEAAGIRIYSATKEGREYYKGLK